MFYVRKYVAVVTKVRLRLSRDKLTTVCGHLESNVSRIMLEG